MAYFTDPMGDEFKKALEEAMKEMEDEEKSTKDREAKSNLKTKRKSKPNKFSRSVKRSLK